jgi:hypothetical protein
MTTDVTRNFVRTQVHSGDAVAREWRRILSTLTGRGEHALRDALLPHAGTRANDH